MPYTVAVSFDKFIENISLVGSQETIASKRTEGIVGLLDSSFKILEAFPMGSLMHGTALKGFADADVLVALHYGLHVGTKTPTQFLLPKLQFQAAD